MVQSNTDASSSEFHAARDYIQDISKILGKVQQLFLPVDPNDQQRGLLIADARITTQAFVLDSKATTLAIDLVNSCIQVNHEKLVEIDRTAEAIFQALQLWLQQRGVTKHLDTPQYSQVAQSSYNKNAARALIDLMGSAQMVLMNLKDTISGGLTSPVLLFPHHFDMSLVWHIDRSTKNNQLSFGFSTGDATISEPYYYCTMYPESSKFKKLQPVKPGHWNSKDFSGIVVKVSEAQKFGNPHDIAQHCLSAVPRVFEA